MGDSNARSHLDEAVVEREAVSYRVLPALSVVVPVVGETAGDELVDVGQRRHPDRRALDRHRDQADVRVGRLGVLVPAASSCGGRRGCRAGAGASPAVVVRPDAVDGRPLNARKRVRARPVSMPRNIRRDDGGIGRSEAH